MKWRVFSNHDLVEPSLDCDCRALLLEGSWPCGWRVGVRDDLDGQIDCRFDWIDEQVALLAEKLSNLTADDQILIGENSPAISPTFLNSLSLRYHLVKLLRVVTYFTEVHPLKPGDSVELTVVRDRDEAYADLFAELCRTSSAKLDLRWRVLGRSINSKFPRNGFVRQLCSRVNRILQSRIDIGATSEVRVILSGNPRLLDPVCEGLVNRGCRVWWLYDRFAFRSWLNWHRRGVGQLTCESDLGTSNHLLGNLPDRLDFYGVNLAPSVERWMAERLCKHGRRQSRIIQQIETHFQNIRPNFLVLSEDATPFSRAAVGVGRLSGVGSYVLQHAVPSSRFAMSPVVADQILSWGRSSQCQLNKLGVPLEKIRITGSPQHDSIIDRLREKWANEKILSAKTRNPMKVLRELGTETGTVAEDSLLKGSQSRSRHILLLASFPHADDRPDLVGYHLNRNTYRQMLEMVFSVVDQMPSVELLVRPHPRMPDEPILHETIAKFDTVRVRFAKDGPLGQWLDEADCVLSCGSSAGVEATLAGLPAIELLPEGSKDLLPYSQWGMVGAARKKGELEQLLAKVFDGQWQPLSVPNRNVFGNFDKPAVEHVMDIILSQNILAVDRSDVSSVGDFQHR